MAITVREKYLRLRERLKDPVYYAQYQRKKLEKQRRYARDPEFCKKRNLATADWRWRKARGLPTRPRDKIRPANVLPYLNAPPSVAPVRSIPPGSTGPFKFTLVSDISVAFD